MAFYRSERHSAIKRTSLTEFSQPKDINPKSHQAASEYIQTSSFQMNKTRQKEQLSKTYF